MTTELLLYMLSVLNSVIPEPLNPIQKDLVSKELMDTALAYERRIQQEMKIYAKEKGLIR